LIFCFPFLDIPAHLFIPLYAQSPFSGYFSPTTWDCFLCFQLGHSQETETLDEESAPPFVSQTHTHSQPLRMSQSLRNY
jgi:hypothetical protein